MLKFIDEADFLLVDTFKENEDGSVSSVWDEGAGNPTHSGIIFDGFTRTKQVQNGTIQVQTGSDENGSPLFETQPVFEDETIDVWSTLWSLHHDERSPVTVLSVDINLLIENAQQQVNAERDALIAGGVEHNGHTFQTDTTSVADIMGAILSGEDTQWLTADNQTVVMSATDMQALGGAVAAHKKSFVYQARVHKDNIESLTTKADIDAYLANLSWG